MGWDFRLYSMLRNSASRPKIGLPGRILAGLLPGRHRNRPGRPKAGRRADFGSFPVAVRPKSGPEGRFFGPEALLRNISATWDGILDCMSGPGLGYHLQGPAPLGLGRLGLSGEGSDIAVRGGTCCAISARQSQCLILPAIIPSF